MAVKELLDKTKELIEQGRLDEAIVAAKHATTLDPNEAEGFWQLALAQAQKDGPAAAVTALRRVTELAPQFSFGWSRLGEGLFRIGEAAEAKTCFLRAIELRDDNFLALSCLAEIYTKEKDTEKELRMLVSLDQHFPDLSFDNLNRIGALHYAAGRYHQAVPYFQRVSRLDNGTTGPFNTGLALAVPTVGRYTDAADAFREALRRDPTHERAPKELTKTISILSALEARVATLGETILNEDQWYQSYLNPFSLLGFDSSVSDDELDAKSLQRARRSMVSEIDLEDGQISWLPGLHIDRSRAIFVSDEAMDATKYAYHLRVFRNPNLTAFLHRGAYRHFIDGTTSLPNWMAALEADRSDFGAWLSDCFAPQFELVFTKAIETRNITAIECLLSGRRWVLPEDEERCFRGSRRHIDLLLEPLRSLRIKSQGVKPSLAALKAALENNNMQAILSKLPLAFTAEQEEAAALVRSISVDTYNYHGDADLARDILQLSQSFALNAQSLQHRLAEDTKTLNERIEAERADEAHLVLREQDCSITREGARFGDNFVATEDVLSIRWGTLISGNQYQRALNFIMSIGAVNGTGIDINWTAHDDLEAQRNLFGKLMNAALTYLIPVAVKRLVDALNAGKRVPFGSVIAVKDGIEFEVKGWFTSARVLCPWSQLKLEIQNGDLRISDALNQKAAAQLPLHQTDNAIALHFHALGAAKGAS